MRAAGGDRHKPLTCRHTCGDQTRLSGQRDRRIAPTVRVPAGVERARVAERRRHGRCSADNRLRKRVRQLVGTAHAQLADVVVAPAKKHAVCRDTACERRARSDGGEVAARADAARCRARVRRAIAQLSELIVSPTIRVTRNGNRADVVLVIAVAAFQRATRAADSDRGERHVAGHALRPVPTSASGGLRAESPTVRGACLSQGTRAVRASTHRRPDHLPSTAGVRLPPLGRAGVLSGTIPNPDVSSDSRLDRPVIIDPERVALKPGLGIAVRTRYEDQHVVAPD